MRQLFFLNSKKFFIFLLFFICWSCPFDLDDRAIKNIKTSLKVKVKRNSPPLIALADVNIKPSFEIQPIQLLANNNLQKTDVFPSTQDAISQKTALSRRILRIKKPLLITAKIMERKIIKTKPLKILHLKGIKLSHSQILDQTISRASGDYIASSPSVAHKNTSTSAKPIKLASISSTRQPSDFERRWLAYTQSLEKSESSYASSNLSLPVNSSLVNNEDQQVGGTAIFPKQKWVGDIWVGLPHQKPSPKPQLIASNASSNNNINSNNDISNRASQESSMMAATMSLNSLLDRDIKDRPIKVVGDITLLEGLGLLKNDNLSVKYVESCSVEKMADIDLSQGRFNIDVEDPFFGFLIAQLRDENGLLRGSSRVLLRDAFREKFLENPDFEINDSVQIDMRITPPDNPAAQIFNVGPNRRDALSRALIEVEEIGQVARSDENGLFFIPELLADSNFMTRLSTQRESARSLWKTLFWSTHNRSYEREALRVETPNDALLTALQNHVPDLSLDLSIIWGRVLKNGQPLQGVSLELADQIHKPYYLTPEGQFVKGGVTTSTGYFVYVNIPPGIQVLEGRGEDFFIPAKVLWTEAGYISSVVLEETSKKEAKGCIFDSQTGDFLPAHLNYLGADTDGMETQSGHLDLRFFNSADLLHFELRPHDVGNYYPVLLTSHRNKNIIPFPVPSRSWIDDLAAKYKITQHPDLSIIVGHISHSSFRAYIDSANGYTDIVYFDRDESSQEPLSNQGGGFVLFNVDPGLHSLILETQHSEQRIAVKTLITDSDFATVFSHSF